MCNQIQVAEADVVTPVVNEKNDNSFQDMLEKMKNVQKKRKEIEDKEKPSFTNKQKFNSGKSGLDSSQGVGSTAGFLDNLMRYYDNILGGGGRYRMIWGKISCTRHIIKNRYGKSKLKYKNL